MSVYPRNLSAFLNRLSGYNKNNVKMNVLGSSDAAHGDTIQVDLPTNSIVDLSSLAWSFDLTWSVTGANGKKHHFPINAESVINRLTVEVNGQTLVNLSNYNVLWHALLYASATDDYQRQRMVAQANSQTGASNGTSVEVTTTTGAPTQSETRSHVVDAWVGFLGSAKPNFIDTSLLGNVRITLTLASNNMIGGDDAASTQSFSIANQAFSIDVCSISDGIYDSMLDQMLASGAPIEVPFKSYFSYSSSNNTMDQTTNFNVASQSIDRLWALARATDAAGVGDAGFDSPAAGHLTTAPVHAIVTKNPAFFNYETCNGANFHFQVNNTLYPQWQSTQPQDWWQHLKLAVGDQGNMLSGSYANALSHYLDNFFVFACSLEHHTDGDERFVSGIDTRGASASCYFKSNQGTNTTDPNTGGAAVRNRTGAIKNQIMVFAECTSSLKIYANKVLEVVQ